MTNAERAREWVKDHGPHIIGGGRFAPRHIDSLTAMLDTVEREAMERAAVVAETFDASGAEGYNIPTWGEGVSDGAWHAIIGIAAAIRALGGSPLQEKHDTGETT